MDAEAEIQELYRKIRVSHRVAARAAREADQIERTGPGPDEAGGLEFGQPERQPAQRGGPPGGLRTVCRGGRGTVITDAATAPRALDEASRKCPRCLKRDTLKLDDSLATDSEDERLPKARLYTCDACDYQLRENYIRQNRLCFPTVGVPSSGKTHWLVMLYRQIKNTNVQVESKIKRIPSREDARFDEMVETILYNLGRPAASVVRIPYPLTFHVNDCDPLGSGQTMVNLFDYSGELTRFSIEGERELSEFRRRALLDDGFPSFSIRHRSPERPVPTSKSQIKALSQFVEEMHAMRGIPMEKGIDLPVAVCISKIDLLVNQNPMGTQAVPLVAELRETMGKTPTLRVIHDRSQAIAEVLPQMFPGWSVERELRENFGGRYMFFPISSVGLDETELGVDDFSVRSFAPFGILEPLLWLLHMHGYCVLN